MESPDFIVPPPGLIPAAPRPSARARPRRPRAAAAHAARFPPPPGGRAARRPRPRPRRTAVEAAAVPPVERVEAPTSRPQPGAWRLRAPRRTRGPPRCVPCVLGRDPVADPGRPEAAHDPRSSIRPDRCRRRTRSSRCVDDRVIVTDLHSTNGTRVLTPDGRDPWSSIRDGAPTVVDGVDAAARRVRRATGSGAVELGVA